MEMSGYGIVIEVDESILLKDFNMSKSDALEGIDKALEKANIGRVLKGAFYMASDENAMRKAFNAIDILKSILWFKKSVSKIMMCKIDVDTISDFIGEFKD